MGKLAPDKHKEVARIALNDIPVLLGCQEGRRASTRRDASLSEEGWHIGLGTQFIPWALAGETLVSELHSNKAMNIGRINGRLFDVQYK